jgi:hypothetical protein
MEEVMGLLMFTHDLKAKLWWLPKVVLRILIAAILAKQY